jgi:hypothetical protein
MGKGAGSAIGTVGGAIIGGFWNGGAGAPAGAALGAGIGGSIGGLFDNMGGGEDPRFSPQGQANQQLADEAWRQRQFLASQGENQTAFANQLAERAMGKAPSLAEAAMRATQDRNLQQQVAAAKSNRSANAGLASRTNAMLGAQQNQQTVQASGQAKLAEQIANQQLYADYMGREKSYLHSVMAAQAGIGTASANNSLAQQQRTDGLMGGLLQTGGQLFGSFMGKGGSGGDVGVPQSGGLGSSRHGSTAMPMQKMSGGGVIPGKALVKGDSPLNDVKPTLLSPGEVVVPRTVVKKGPKAIASFADALLKSKQPDDSGYGKVLAAKKRR